MIVLSPDRERALVEALANAFKPAALEVRVMDPMRIPKDARSAAQSYLSRIADLVRWATAQGRIDDLLRTALQANPQNGPLRLLNEATGLIPPTIGLEEAVRAAKPLISLEDWQRTLLQVERQVCVVQAGIDSAPGVARGCGFLIGPDQVMTHAQALADGPAAVETARFGTISVTFEPHSASRKTYHALPEPIFVSETGVVVLRLDRPAGREIPFDQEAAASGRSLRARGWVALASEDARHSGSSEREAAPAHDRTVVIFQYADGTQPAVSIDVNGLIGSETDPLAYLTSTHPSSIGAPCFDASWRFRGMHVGSDRERSRNFGIRGSAILDALRAQGLVWDLSSGVRLDRPAVDLKTTADELDAVVRDFAVAETPDLEDDVWTDGDDVDVADPDRWAWAEAAAVTAFYQQEKLVPLGDPPAEACVAVLLESTPLRRPDGSTRWMLGDRVRRRALQRLADRGALYKALASNPGDPAEPLDAVLSEFLSGTPPSRAELQDPVRLRAMLQVSAWLSGTGLPLPPADALQAALERATLIAPFRHLTRGFFAGREAELATLAAYVDGPDTDNQGEALPPLLIHGPGGMGKSALLAHFILAHSDRDTTRPDAWRPFVYLDFDRPDLDARDLADVLVAVARQIGPQVPAVRDRADALIKSWGLRRRSHRPEASDATKNRQVQLSSRTSAADLDDLLNVLAGILTSVHASLTAPLVLVLDTLEEVQYSTPDAVVPLAELVVRLRAEVPSLRAVLAGRVELDPRVTLTPLPLGPLPAKAAEALLGNHLPPSLAAKTDLVSRMVHIVGGNPLSLRLAAEVLSHEVDQEDLGEEQLWQRVGDAIVQGQLYERIVGHIHAGPVKQLAIPGLVLRYLTWELIRDVLARPCGIEVEDDAGAQALFADLAKEVAVVRHGVDASKLVVRPELRRTVLDAFRQDKTSRDKRRLIHQAAVDYFAPLPGVENRAEEIYHRLWLDQDPSAIDLRWLHGLDLILRGAVDELDGRARSYLANRVGSIDEETLAGTAALREWEAYAEKRASDLLRLGLPAAALDILRRRGERLSTSRLHLIESVALRSLPTPNLVAAGSAAERAVAAARASADPEEIQGAIQELVQIRRLEKDTAGVLRALADMGNLGEQLGDDLILLRADVETLESMSLDEGTARFSENAVRVFSRLPDEVVATAPELARRVAAQVGGENPAVVQRVIRLVGVGSLNGETAAGLESVLAEWAERDPDVQPFLPKSPITANEVSSAAQYLFGSRNLDKATTEHLSTWMRSVVTPTT